VTILYLDERYHFHLAQLDKVILQVHLRLLQQNVCFFRTLSFDFHEKPVVNVGSDQTIRIDVRPILDALEIPMIKVRIIEIRIDHGKTQGLMPEKIIDFLLSPAILSCCCIHTLLDPDLYVFEDLTIEIALELKFIFIIDALHLRNPIHTDFSLIEAQETFVFTECDIHWFSRFDPFLSASSVRYIIKDHGINDISTISRVKCLL